MPIEAYVFLSLFVFHFFLFSLYIFEYFSIVVYVYLLCSFVQYVECCHIVPIWIYVIHCLIMDIKISSSLLPFQAILQWTCIYIYILVHIALICRIHFRSEILRWNDILISITKFPSKEFVFIYSVTSKIYMSTCFPTFAHLRGKWQIIHVTIFAP